jgi:hypothetical protein
MIDWPEGEPVRLFRDCAIEARKLSVVAFEMSMRSEALHGIPRTVIHDGHVCYQEDEELVRLGEDYAIGVLGYPDMYKRDAQGNRIPLVVYDPAPAMTKVHMLRSLMPQTYNPGNVVNVDQKISGGVLVLTGNAKEVPALAPPAVEPAALAPEPVEREASNSAQVDTASDDDAATPRDDDSPLVADLKRRLREGVANPAPKAPVMIGKPSDEDEPMVAAPTLPQPQRRQFDGVEGIGEPKRPPGGYRTVG